MAAHVRRAEVGDAGAIARVHVAAWQAAYRGVMPDAYLDGLDQVQRAAQWSSQLEAGAGLAAVVADPVTFVLEHNGVVAAIATVGPARDDPSAGELWMINVDPASWGSGLGRALLAHVTQELRDAGFAEARLWVVAENERARRFYEAAGWTSEGTIVTDASHGFTINEVRYRRQL